MNGKSLFVNIGLIDLADVTPFPVTFLQKQHICTVHLGLTFDVPSQLAIEGLH